MTARDGAGWGRLIHRASDVVAQYLAQSDAVCVLAADREGVIQGCNAALARRLDQDAARLTGQDVWGLMPHEDAVALRDRLGGDDAAAGDSFLLNFLGRDQVPFTLQCQLGIEPDGFVLLGERPPARDEDVERKLVSLNNQLAVLSRENERKRKALARKEQEVRAALQELETSYWHLRKIQEVLPVCMDCGKVKTGEHDWANAVEYLKQNALFLSHGYCPACEERLLAEL